MSDQLPAHQRQRVRLALFGDTYGTSLLLNGEAGVQVYASKSWDAKLEYRMLAANQYLNPSLGLRFARHYRSEKSGGSSSAGYRAPEK